MVFKRNFSTGGAAVEIVDALNSTATDKALSANQGRALDVAKSDTTHNHDADYASKASEHTHANKSALDKISDSGDGSKMLADDGTYVTPSSGVDVIDALNSTSPTAALSANQGKVLNDGKADTTHNHDLDYADIAHVSDTNNPHSVTAAQVGLSNVDNTADADKPVAVRRVQQTGLACNFANHSYIIATISANSSFTITNLPTDQMVTVLINNTSQTDVTVTLPNTADVKPSADYVIGGGGGKYREFSIYFDGVTRFWQVSEELV